MKRFCLFDWSCLQRGQELSCSPGSAAHTFQAIGLLLILMALSACSLPFGGSEAPAATPTQQQRALVPTFTPTVAVQDTAMPEPPPATSTPASPTLTTTEEVTTLAALSDTGSVANPTLAQPSAPVKAQLVINEPVANLRNGPGTNYGIVGSVNKGQQLEIVSKNTTGDWWKICCVNGEPGWVFGQLASVQNTENVPVEQNIAPPPTAPVAQSQPQTAPPTQAPAAATAAPPAADPCAGIGGDGCKFKLKAGPSFGGGGELKLQLLFVHSGVEGGQAQGSYFVAMFKDGQKLPIGDTVRSIAIEKSQGVLGPYNYEYTLAPDQIPGGSLAGTYTIYVLDGNGERDSKDFTITVPDGQGLVYIVFDQA